MYIPFCILFGLVVLEAPSHSAVFHTVRETFSTWQPGEGSLLAAKPLVLVIGGFLAQPPELTPREEDGGGQVKDAKALH